VGVAVFAAELDAEALPGAAAGFAAAVDAAGCEPDGSEPDACDVAVWPLEGAAVCGFVFEWKYCTPRRTAMATNIMIRKEVLSCPPF
jgi:hypothetical protein